MWWVLYNRNKPRSWCEYNEHWQVSTKIKQLIEREPINDTTKRLILRNILLCKYYDKDVLILKIIRGKDPIKYDGSIYIRKMANTDPTPIAQDDEFEFYKEFIEQSSRYPYL